MLFKTSKKTASPVILGLLLTFNIFASPYPEIPRLSSFDDVFKQFQEEVEYSNKEMAKLRIPELNFYQYKCTENDSIISVAARCSLRQDTIATLNGFSDKTEDITGKTIILPVCNGIFVNENPSTPLEILVKSENNRESDIFSDPPLKIKVQGKILTFYPGRKFSGTTRNFFLDANFRLPLEHTTITSSFGMRKNPISGNFKFHEGVDLACPENTRIYACKGGIVKEILNNDYIYGNCIKLEHAGGITSVYAHLSSVNVEEGQIVKSGQIIGKSGSTGAVTGPHLHFEIRDRNRAINPKDYVNY